MKKHWIFDWSGTLVDDLGVVIDATNTVLEHYGVDKMDRETFCREFSLPYDRFYKKFLPQVDVSELEALFRSGFSDSSQRVSPLPYAYDFLEKLKASGAKMYVLSSMSAPEFEMQADELRMAHFFEATYAGVLDKREVIGEMMSAHGMGQAETVFVGDMTHDVETAHHAGIMSIGLLTGYNHAAALAEAEPEIMAKNLSVLFPVIPDSSSTDLVKIRGLELPTFIGVPDDERASSQVLKVNVDMIPKSSFGLLQDEIEGGVDYYQVSLKLKEVALVKPRKLIETLAEDLAQVVLRDFEVSQVRIEIEKFILPDTEYVGVEIWR